MQGQGILRLLNASHWLHGTKAGADDVSRFAKLCSRYVTLELLKDVFMRIIIKLRRCCPLERRICCQNSLGTTHLGVWWRTTLLVLEIGKPQAFHDHDDNKLPLQGRCMTKAACSKVKNLGRGVFSQPSLHCSYVRG